MVVVGAVAVTVFLGDQAAIIVVDVLDKLAAQGVVHLQQAVFAVVGVGALRAQGVRGNGEVAVAITGVLVAFSCRVDQGGDLAVAVPLEQHTLTVGVEDAVVGVGQGVAVGVGDGAQAYLLVQLVHVAVLGGKQVVGGVGLLVAGNLHQFVGIEAQQAVVGLLQGAGGAVYGHKIELHVCEG